MGWCIQPKVDMVLWVVALTDDLHSQSHVCHMKSDAIAKLYTQVLVPWQFVMPVSHMPKKNCQHRGLQQYTWTVYCWGPIWSQVLLLKVCLGLHNDCPLCMPCSLCKSNATTIKTEKRTSRSQGGISWSRIGLLLCFAWQQSSILASALPLSCGDQTHKDPVMPS